MENMQVLLSPKEIHISTQSALSLRLTYKKIAISTNHQLEKYQNRESYPIRNGVANINDEVKFRLSKQFELNNTKIVIVVIGIKGRDICCLGDISLDLASLREKMNKQKDSFKIRVEKCKDPRAYLVFELRFVQKAVDIMELKKSRKQKEVQKLPETGILKTDYYYKEQLYISRREKHDKPTAYQISRKNYKNNQIVRNNTTVVINKTVSKEKRVSTDSLKENTNNGSYKKRFMYDVKRTDKDKSSNYLKVYQKDKSPSPRIKTPEPITLEALKSRETTTHQRTKSKVEPLNLSSIDYNKNDSELVDPDTFRAHPSHYVQTQSIPTNQQQHNISHSNISVSSISSINNEKDSKYKMITEKLQMIESKIREQKEKYNDVCDDERGSKVSRKEIDEISDYTIREGSKRESPKTEKVSISRGKAVSPFQDAQGNYSKKSLSLADSTCPRNERAPSPIHQTVVETPEVVKKQPQSVKMSQFTINSRKNEVAELQQQKTPQNESPLQESVRESHVTTTMTFDKISSPGISHGEHKQSSIGPSPRVGSREKREISPGYERRQSQLMLQKRPSLGRNYIETQVKMLELQIQEKEMKYERLEKRYAKKQEECAKLGRLNEEYQRRVMEVSNQLIEARSNVLRLERESERMEQLVERVKEKQLEIIQNKQLITKLTAEIQGLRQVVGRQPQIKEMPKKLPSEDKRLQTQPLIDQTMKYKLMLSQKQSAIGNLNSQLETYLNEIASLRKRNDGIVEIKQKYQQLNDKYQQSLIKLEDKQKQSPIDRLSPNNKSGESPQSSVKNLSPQSSSRSAQQLLQQTIQKQTLLQQSLKSLQGQNRSLESQKKSLESQNKTLGEELRLMKEEKQQMSQRLANSQTENARLQSQIIELKSAIQQYRQKETQSQLQLRQVSNQKDLLTQKLSRKQKTIQKLSTINESLNAELFTLEEEKKQKIQELNEQTETLVLRNAENQQLIKELEQKLAAKQKEMGILKQALREREDEQNQRREDKRQQMRRQPSSESQQSMRQPLQMQTDFSKSKSAQLVKVKVKQQGKENFYENYLNEKAKSTNLQAQLRYAQNDMRNLKMKIDLLQQQKKDLQQEIDMIAYNNEKDLAMKGLKHKISMENQSITDSVKLENRALKEEIKLLQSQVQDLNALIDSAIQRTANFQASQIAQILSNPQMQKSIINEKYLAMVRRIQAYQMQLRSKKNKLAEIVNAIWRGGNATLIDEIDRIMGADQ